MSKKALLLLSATVIVAAIAAGFVVSGKSGGTIKYGAPVDTADAEEVELASLFASPQDYAGKNVIVNAQAGQVCQSSGCWITVTDGVNQLFVQFYDFTVKGLRPGSKVRVLGQVREQNGAPYLVGQGLEILK